MKRDYKKLRSSEYSALFPAVHRFINEGRFRSDFSKWPWTGSFWYQFTNIWHRYSSAHQTLHLCFGFIGEPKGQLKASANSGKLTSVPFTLQMGKKVSSH